MLLLAMSTRGAKDASSKNPLRRVRAVVTTLLPLLLASLKRSGDIALAMELRGYRSSARRTYVNGLQFRSLDWVLLSFALTLLAVSVTYRIYVGLPAGGW